MTTSILTEAIDWVKEIESQEGYYSFGKLSISIGDVQSNGCNRISFYFYAISVIYLLIYWVRSVALLKDIIKEDEIKLDWFFKASLIQDTVKVSVSSLIVKFTISCDINTGITNHIKSLSAYQVTP